MHALELVAGFRHASFSISSSNVLLIRHYLQEAVFPHPVILCHSCAALKISHYCLSGAKRGQVSAKKER